MSIIEKVFHYEENEISVLSVMMRYGFEVKAYLSRLVTENLLKLYTLMLIRRIRENCPILKVYPKTGYTYG